MPTVLHETDGKERLVFDGYWKMSFDLYVTNVDEPVKEAATIQIPTAPGADEGPAALRARHPGHPRPRQQGEVQRAASSSSRTPQTYFGVNSDQTYLGRILLPSPTTWAITGSSPT